MGVSAHTLAAALLTVALAVGGCAAALLQQQGGLLREPHQQQEGGAPLTYHIPDENEGRLATVRTALDYLGYTATDDPLRAHVVWTLGYPYSFSRSRMAAAGDLAATLQASPLDVEAQSSLPFINHLPGTPLVAHKQKLGGLAGGDALSFLPRTFRVPAEFEAWQQFLATPEGAAMEWVRKSGQHGGVESVEDPRDAKHGKPHSKAWLAQQLVRPYVLHNRVWDLGVYVAISSVQPLVAYVHTGFAVLRFTSEDYQGSGGNKTRPGWVIHDALTPAELEAAQAHFSDAGIRTIITASRVLAWLAGHGLDSQALWLEAQSQIVQVLQAVNTAMVDASDALPLTHTNAFELLRFDFMLDEHKRLFLIECNMSPSLTVLAEDVSMEQQKPRQRLVHDVLSLKGLALGGLHHPATSPGLKRLFTDPVMLDVQETACAGTCRANCSSSPRCMLCHACRSQLQTHILQQLQAEHYGSHNFLRIHPPHRQLAGFMADQGVEGVPEVADRPEDVLVASWLAAKCRVDPRWC